MLKFWRIVVRCLVQELGRVREHQESMRQALRDPQLPLVLGRECLAYPATKGWGVFTNIYRNIKDLALRHPNQLALGIWVLEVQAAQHTPGGLGVVVLHKLHLTTNRRLKPGVVKALEEEAPIVPKDLGLD